MPETALPLHGRTVVVTRARAQAAALVQALEQLGAEVLAVPVIRVVPRPIDDRVRGVLARLGEYQLVAFTSANGVEVFLGYLAELGDAPAAVLAGATVAAIGPATAAALERHGLSAGLVPPEHVAEGLVKALLQSRMVVAHARVLLPQAGEARAVLADGLREHGAQVDVLPVYDTLPAESLAVPPERIEEADFITFTSGSTVRHFVRLMQQAGAGGPLAERLAGARLCSIGPLTSKALRELDLAVAAEATSYSADGLLRAVVALSTGSSSGSSPSSLAGPSAT
jgi:uroporphyrinogen III methyltransferase / synthase